jgi:hypothetical protein
MGTLLWFPEPAVISDLINNINQLSTSTLLAVNESAIIFKHRASDVILFRDTWKKTYVDRCNGQQIFEAIQNTSHGGPVDVSTWNLFVVSMNFLE